MVTTTCQPLNLCKHSNPEIIPFFSFSQSVWSDFTPEPEYHRASEVVIQKLKTVGDGACFPSGEITNIIGWFKGLSVLWCLWKNKWKNQIHIPLLAKKKKKDNGQITVVKTYDTLKIILFPNCWPQKWGLWWNVWFSQCDYWTDNITFTWELIRKANYWVPSWGIWLRNFRGAVQKAVFENSFQRFWCRLKCETNFTCRWIWATV